MKSFFLMIFLCLSSLTAAASVSHTNVEIYKAPFWIENVSSNGGLVSNVNTRHDGQRKEKLVVMSKDGNIQFESAPQTSSWSPVTALSANSKKLYYIDRSRSFLMMASKDGETRLGNIAIDSSVYLSEIIPTANADLLVLRYSSKLGLRNQTSKISLFSIAQGKNISIKSFPITDAFIRFVESRYLAIHTPRGGYSLYEMTDEGLIYKDEYTSDNSHKFITLDLNSSVATEQNSSREVYATILGSVDEPRINQRMKVGVWNLNYGPVTEANSKVIELPYKYIYGSYPRIEDGFLLSPTEAVILISLESEKKLLKVNFSTGQIEELLTSHASGGQYGINHQSKAFWSWDTIVRFNP